MCAHLPALRAGERACTLTHTDPRLCLRAASYRTLGAAKWLLVPLRSRRLHVAIRARSEVGGGLGVRPEPLLSLLPRLSPPMAALQETEEGAMCCLRGMHPKPAPPLSCSLVGGRWWTWAGRPVQTGRGLRWGAGPLLQSRALCPVSGRFLSPPAACPAARGVCAAFRGAPALSVPRSLGVWSPVLLPCSLARPPSRSWELPLGAAMTPEPGSAAWQ